MAAVGPVSDVLRLLADCDSTGRLEVPGEHGGTFHLVDGVVESVETDAVPGVWARLGDQRPPDEELAVVARSVLVDATAALLSEPLSVPPRFQSTTHDSTTHDSTTHDSTLNHLARTAVVDLLSAAAPGLGRLMACGVRPDDELELRPELAGRAVRLDRGAWALLAGFEGARTPRDLAWRVGRPLVDTVVSAADLVAQGACIVRTTAPRPGPSFAAAVRPEPVRAQEPSSSQPAGVVRVTEPLPRRRGSGGRDRAAGGFAVPVDSDLLLRLMDGLRRL